MDVCEVRRRVKSWRQLEFPAKHKSFVEKSLHRSGRGAFSLDLKPLPVEIDTSVIVRRYVDVKDENRLVQVGIGGLGDVMAEAGMAAIRSFRAGPKHILNQRVTICLAICAQNCRLREQRRRAYQ